jgi:hypothetical protein
MISFLATSGELVPTKSPHSHIIEIPLGILETDKNISIRCRYNDEVENDQNLTA